MLILLILMLFEFLEISIDFFYFFLVSGGFLLEQYFTISLLKNGFAFSVNLTFI